MPAELFGIEHTTYIIISTIFGGSFIILTKLFVLNEKNQRIILKIVASLLFIAIMTNRLSQVFRYDTVRWYYIIPDSYCGMTSLVLSIAVLFGKKDNCVYHFVWLLALFGGISTVIYATFVSQGPTIFYLPTISGLLHHSFSAILTILILIFKQIHITYKKWYCTFFGFTAYITIGAFLMQTFNMSDAFHISEPLLPNTILTTWGMAPMYICAYTLILLVIELIRINKNKSLSKN